MMKLTMSIIEEYPMFEVRIGVVLHYTYTSIKFSPTTAKLDFGNFVVYGKYNSYLKYYRHVARLRNQTRKQLADLRLVYEN